LWKLLGGKTNFFWGGGKRYSKKW